MQPPSVLEIAKPLVQEFEDCKLHEYLDMRGLPTIGWGQRIRHGQFPNGITQAQADKMFEISIEGFYNGVRELTRGVPDLPNELAALTDFAYNVGFGSWHPFADGLATSTLLRLYVGCDKVGAAKEFLRWDHVNGVESPGLLRRRKCEKLIFEGKSIADLQKLRWLT